MEASVNELQSQITELQAHINAANARMHYLVCEFNKRQGWAGWGVRSMEHWLSWQLGYSYGNASATTRTAHALQELPKTADAFAKGEISQDQVRAIASAASPQTEEHLLHIARYGTGAHLARLCRLYRQVLVANGLEPARRFVEHYVRFRYEDDGSLRMSGRFPADEGEIIRQAMSAVMEELRRDRKPAPPPPPPAPELPPMLEDLPEDPILKELFDRLENEDEEEPYEAPSVAPATPIAVEAPGHDCLAADALLAMAERSLAHRLAQRPSSERFKVIVHLDRMGAELERGTPVPADILERMACDAQVVRIHHDLSCDAGTKGISARVRREVNARDRHCRFPGCTATAYTDLHHILPRSLGGGHDKANLIRQCWHHHQKIHAIGYRIELVGDEFVFRHPAGWLLERPTQGLDPGSPSLESQHSHLEIAPDTATSRWIGDRCDYGMAIDALMHARGQPG